MWWVLVTVAMASADAVTEVREAETAFARSMADRDIDAFRQFVSEEAIFAAGAGALRGRDAIVEGWARYFAGESAPFSWRPDQVLVLESGTLALSTGPVLDPEGQIVGRFISTWRLEPDGRWRVVFDRGCNCVSP